MDLSELRLLQNEKNLAQISWNGTAPLESELSRDILPSLLTMLPSRKSSDDELWAQLQLIAGRFLRRLSQDEFGPRRTHQIDMLKLQLMQFDELKKLLSKYPDTQFLEFCSDLHPMLSTKPRIDSDTLMDAMHDTAGPDQANLAQICVFLAQASDTNTSSRVAEEEAYNPRLPFHLPPLNEFVPKTLSSWIDIISSGRQQMLTELQEKGGPAPRETLMFVIHDLARIWIEETGNAVTYFPTEKAKYTGRCESPSGKFILAAIQAMLPRLDNFTPDFLSYLPKGARIFADVRGGLATAVATGLKNYVNENVKPEKNGRKPSRK